MGQKEPVEILSREDVAVVTFGATCLSAVEGIEEVSREITAFITENYPKKMVIDFHRVKFLSSQTLGLLLDVWRRLHEYDGRVVISGINPQLHRVFKITNLDKIFDFYADTESAIEAVKVT